MQQSHETQKKRRRIKYRNRHVHAGLRVWQQQQRASQQIDKTPQVPAFAQIKKLQFKLFQEKRMQRFLSRQGSDLSYGSFGDESSGETSVRSDQSLSPKT
ncbi:MAG: hypothetical protein P1U34_06865 [Coxiellaceae bacterium]|nr:hypothetical protein [Coxiellaceae bacterium]